MSRLEPLLGLDALGGPFLKGRLREEQSCGDGVATHAGGWRAELPSAFPLLWGDGSGGENRAGTGARGPRSSLGVRWLLHLSPHP